MQQVKLDTSYAAITKGITRILSFTILFLVASCSSESSFPRDKRVNVESERTNKTFSKLQGKILQKTETSESYVTLTQDRFDECFPPTEGGTGKEICLDYRITEWNKNRFLAKLPQSNAEFVQVCDVENNLLNCYTVTTSQNGYERAISNPSKFPEYISETTIYKVKS